MFLEFIWEWKGEENLCGWSPRRGTRHLKDAKL